jgi:hypothetical protein
VFTRTALGYILAVTALVPAACQLDDPLAVRSELAPAPEPPDTLGVLGHGRVPERYTAEVAARGGWAYTTTWGNRADVRGNAIKIWNVSGEAPLLGDSLIVENAITLGDVQISDDGKLLVVATERQNGSIVIYDLTNPAKPVRLARHTSTDTGETGVHTVKLGRVAGRLYAFLSVNPSPPRLVVVDITDPSRPQEVLVQTMGSPVIHDVFVRDGILFTALWNEGLTIWDIGGGGSAGASPSSPVQLGNVRTVGGQAHSAWWFHDPAGAKRYVFVGQEGPAVAGVQSSGDLHVVDVSDPKSPREVAFYTVPSAGAHNMVMDEANQVLYVSYYNGGVRALDVSGSLDDCDLEERSVDGRCNLGLMGREVAVALQDRGRVSIWGVARVGTRVYASDMLSGLFVIDATPLSGGTRP